MNLLSLLIILAVFVIIAVFIVTLITAGTEPLKNHWRSCDRSTQITVTQAPITINSPCSSCVGPAPLSTTTHVGGMPVQDHINYLKKQQEMAKNFTPPHVVPVVAPPPPPKPVVIDVVQHEELLPDEKTTYIDSPDDVTSAHFKIVDDCPTTKNERQGRQLFMSHPQHSRIRLHKNGGFIVESKDKKNWKWVKRLNIGGKVIGYDSKGFFVEGGHRTKYVIYTTLSGKEYSLKLESL